MSSSGFPPAATGVTQFHVADTASGKNSELILVTNVSGTTWTVTRGAESTTPVSHATGFSISQVVTAGWLSTVATSAATAPAYQFTPEAYGAHGDGKVITDANMTNGSPTLTTTTSTPFTAGDVNKYIVVSGAGGSSTQPLCAKITGYTANNQVTLGTNASATVANAGIIYGTDDTAAIQSAINAAVTYAQGSQSQFAEVKFSASYYVVASPLTQTGAYNAQITLPTITASSGYKVSLKLSGVSDVTAPPEHWLQVSQNAPGSVLVCAYMTTQTVAYLASNGPAAMIGGPVGGMGGGAGTYSNMQLTVEGLTCLLPWISSIGGLNLFGLGQAWVKSFAVMPMAIVPSGFTVNPPPTSTQAWPELTSGGPASLQYTAGLIMPAEGNNDRNDIDYYTCYGAYIGLSGSDHLNWKSMRTLFCGVGWMPSALSVQQGHASAGLHWSCEATSNPILCLEGTVNWGGYKLSGYVSMNIDALGLETFASGHIVHGDSNGYLSGQINFESLQASGQTTNRPFYSSLTDAVSIKLVSMEVLPGPALTTGSAAPPASTHAFNNYYYRDAWVTVALTSGTFGSLNIDGTAQPNAAGASTYQFLLPAGHAYTPTYSGTLSHTLTLL